MAHSCSPHRSNLSSFPSWKCIRTLSSLPFLPSPSPQPPGPRRSQQGQRKEPRKIITSMSLCDDVQLNKAEKAWKPSAKKLASGRGLTGAEESEDEDPEQVKTQELFKRVRSVLNKLTPQMFQQLMKQVTDLTIDTEERLKGGIDLVFEKAIDGPSFSVAYGNMCRCLATVRCRWSFGLPRVSVSLLRFIISSQVSPNVSSIVSQLSLSLSSCLSSCLAVFHSVSLVFFARFLSLSFMSLSYTALSSLRVCLVLLFFWCN